MSHGTPNLGLARHVVVWVFLVSVAFAGFFITGSRREQETVRQIPESVSMLKQTAAAGTTTTTTTQTATQTTTQPSTGIAAADSNSNNNNNNNEIVQGLSGNVPYYHCPGIRSTGTGTGTGTSSNHKDIVLLHGSRFTKEDWKTSGILEKLCQSGDASSSSSASLRSSSSSASLRSSAYSYSSISVTALDLHVRSNHEVLRETLIGLAANNLVTLPVTAIVTPSASGFAVVDWLQQAADPQQQQAADPQQQQAADQQQGGAGVIDDLQRNYFQAWIPVASPSISLLTDAQLTALASAALASASHTPVPFSILAVYGSNDRLGKQVSQRLQRLASAVTVELEGAGHACYLDAPDAFVERLVHYVRQLP